MYKATLAKFREMYERNEDCCVCGRTVDSNENYCFNCGQRLDWEAEK